MGDPQARERITDEVRALYDQVETWAFALTSENVLELAGARGTHLQAGLTDGRVSRLIASTWTTQGMYAAEFYLREGALLHVYETFEYVQESAPPSAWVNFKGLPAWERRVYFAGGELRYSEVIGVGATHPEDAGRHLKDAAYRLLGLLQTPEARDE